MCVSSMGVILRIKVLVAGKNIANGKGVVSDCESEGSWMANLWSDEQKLHKAIAKDKTAQQNKVQ